MAKCEICGKSPQFGHNVSHSKRATSRQFKPNIQRVREDQWAEATDVSLHSLPADAEQDSLGPSPAPRSLPGLPRRRRRKVGRGALFCISPLQRLDRAFG